MSQLKLQLRKLHDPVCGRCGGVYDVGLASESRAYAVCWRKRGAYRCMGTIPRFCWVGGAT